MSNFIKRSPLFILSLFFILLLSMYLQSWMDANRDAVWLLHCTQLFLQGGQYYKDFFETNPPLALFFHVPPEIIATWFGWNDYFTLAGYVYGLSILSIALSYFLLKKSHFSDMFTKSFLCVFAVVVSIVPFFWFLDRETYAIILTFPYVLLILCRLLQAKIPPSLSVLIGFLAAIGFGIKPYFLLPLFFIELYLMIMQRTIFSWWRVESVTLFLCLFFYLLSVVVFLKVYLTDVMPLSALLYLPAFEKASWGELLSFALAYHVQYGLIVLAWAFFNWREKKERTFFSLLALRCAGFLIAYFIQSRKWYYHIYPSVAMLLLILSGVVILFFLDLMKLKTVSMKLISQGVCAFLAMALISGTFSTALCMNMVYFSAKTEQKAPNAMLIHYLNQYAQHQNVFIVSNWFLQESVRYNTSAIVTSRFPSMLLVPGIQLLHNQNRVVEAQQAKTKFMQLIMEDVKRHPPVWIVIEQEGFQSMYAGRGLRYKFLPFFLSDPVFYAFFQHYKLVAVLPDYRIYHYCQAGVGVVR